MPNKKQVGPLTSVSAQSANTSAFDSTTIGSATLNSSSRIQGFLDLVERDPNGMNDWLEIEFEDILAEPSIPRSVDM